MVRLLLVDDVPAVRQGLRMRLALEPDLDVIGEAGTAAEAFALIGDGSPDVVVMDVTMPGVDGIAAAEMLRALSPCCKVVMLTIHDDTATQARARCAGAVGFVSKNGDLEALVSAVRQAGQAQA